MEIQKPGYQSSGERKIACRYESPSKSEIYLPHFSIINLRMNRTFYYCKEFFKFIDLKKDQRFEFFKNQEKKFIQLIIDAEAKDSLAIWSK